MERELDTTGLKCPLPVLRARRELETMKDGEQLYLLASDPVSVSDVPAFCRIAGHQLVMAETKAGEYRFIIEKGTGEILDSVESLPRLARSA